MATGRKWRIGVIGCGAWGPNHVRNFSALPNVEVVGAADLQPDRLARVKAIVPGVATFTDAAEMMATAQPDAVVVSTPTMTHFDVVRQALAAGKHVLCEKPLCLTGDEADALVRLADERGLRLMVGHVFMFNPGILKLQGTGRAPANWAAASTTCSPAGRTSARSGSDVNAVLDLASHDVSIYNFLLDATPTRGVGRRQVVPAAGHPGRQRHHAHVPGRRHRLDPRELARSEEGPRDHGRRRPADGHLGRPGHAGPGDGVRQGRDEEAARVRGLRRVPAADPRGRRHGAARAARRSRSACRRRRSSRRSDAPEKLRSDGRVGARRGAACSRPSTSRWRRAARRSAVRRRGGQIAWRGHQASDGARRNRPDRRGHERLGLRARDEGRGRRQPLQHRRPRVRRDRRRRRRRGDDQERRGRVAVRHGREPRVPRARTARSRTTTARAASATGRRWRRRSARARPSAPTPRSCAAATSAATPSSAPAPSSRKPVPDYAVVLGNPGRVRGYVCECCQPLAGRGRGADLQEVRPALREDAARAWRRAARRPPTPKPGARKREARRRARPRRSRRRRREEAVTATRPALRVHGRVDRPQRGVEDRPRHRPLHAGPRRSHRRRRRRVDGRDAGGGRGRRARSS